MITVDITNIRSGDWEYRTNRQGKVYRANLLVLALREAGIPADGVLKFLGVWKGSYRIEQEENKTLFVWED